MQVEGDERLTWFCIFPYDLLKLICFNCTDPKTRYNMLLTCKRLFSEIYQYAFQRRWLMIGMEPPEISFTDYSLQQCSLCSLIVRKEKPHKCLQKKLNINYCVWCLQRTGKKTHQCTRLMRCSSCGAIPLHSHHTCPLSRIRCDCGRLHQIILFQSCEVCVQREYVRKTNFICPNALPRCKEHAIYECFGCEELVDCALLEPGTRHACKLLKHCVEAELGVRLIKYTDEAYITETGIGLVKDLKIMFVKTTKSIPSLLEFKRVRVCLFSDNLPVLLNFQQEPERVVQPVHMAFTFLSRCKICFCTIVKNLALCSCRRAEFCKTGCRQLDQEHSKHKKLK